MSFIYIREWNRKCETKADCSFCPYSLNVSYSFSESPLRFTSQSRSWWTAPMRSHFRAQYKRKVNRKWLRDLPYHQCLSSCGMWKLVLDQVSDLFSVDSLHWCTQDDERNTERKPRAVRQDEKVSGGSKVGPREGASWHDKNAREGIAGIFCFSVLLVGYSKNIMEKIANEFVCVIKCVDKWN